MTERPTAFHDLKPGDFPLVIEYLNTAGEVVEKVTIDGPGVLDVPALAHLYGPISVRVTYGTGEVLIDGTRNP